MNNIPFPKYKTATSIRTEWQLGVVDSEVALPLAGRDGLQFWKALELLQEGLLKFRSLVERRDGSLRRLYWRYWRWNVGWIS